MSQRIESGIATVGRAQFESPLRLWIAIWQRQLVNGTACAGPRQRRRS